MNDAHANNTVEQLTRIADALEQLAAISAIEVRASLPNTHPDRRILDAAVVKARPK